MGLRPALLLERIGLLLAFGALAFYLTHAHYLIAFSDPATWFVLARDFGQRIGSPFTASVSRWRTCASS